MTAVEVHRSGQLIGVQRRLAELGRLRYGEVATNKAGKPFPRSLTKWRLTSASRELLTAAAEIYGGKVREWKDAPDPGMFELYTTTAELDVLLPPVYSAHDGTPTYPYSQAYELWEGPTLERRCDGETATVPKGRVMVAKPCLCNPEDRACKVTTRVTVMLPRLPGIGVWRMDSRGWTVATQLPGTLDLLTRAAAARRFVPATLRLESRSRKVREDDGTTTTNRFVVPVLDLGVTPAQLVAAMGPEAHTWNVEALPVAEKPLLTGGPDPAEGGHTRPQAAWGEETPLTEQPPQEAPVEPPGTTPPAAVQSDVDGDPWMRAIHAMGTERGLDHDALHQRAVDAYGVASLKDLNPLQRGKFRKALEDMPAVDGSPVPSAHGAGDVSTPVPIPASASADEGAAAHSTPDSAVAASAAPIEQPAAAASGSPLDSPPSADTIDQEGAVYEAARAHGIFPPGSEGDAAWAAIETLGRKVFPGRDLNDYAPADWVELGAQIAAGQHDPKPPRPRRRGGT